MPAPSFEQVFGSSLFVLPRAPGDVGWVGYLVKQGEAPPPRPITILQGLREVAGHFLFAPTAPPLGTPDEVLHFVTAVWNYLNESFGRDGVFHERACVWIPDPRTPSFGPPIKYAFQYGGWGRIVLQSGFDNPIGTRTSLCMPSGVWIEATETSLVFTGRAADNITFLPEDGPPAIDPDYAELPCVGPYSGCLLFGGSLVPSVALTFFEAGVRYYHPAQDGAAACQVYPVVSTASGTPLRYVGALDPLDPVNAGPTVDRKVGRMRTLLAPLPLDGAPPFLDGWLRTATGLATRLAPLGGGGPAGPAVGAGAFVFERSGPADDPASDVYLTFAGDWAVAVDDPPGGGPQAGLAHELLCGVDGLERISFRAYAPDARYDRLRFVPGRAAFAPRFPFADASITNLVGADELLKETYRTSWANVVSENGADIEYLAQPASSPLYEVVSAAADAPAIFDWLRTDVDLPQAADFGVPLAPYAGVPVAPRSFPPGELTSFETEVLAPTRKRLIAPPTLAVLRTAKAARLARGADDEALRTATTPQGFVVELEGASYRRITLARSSGPDLAFLDVTPELQSLLQTNQLFAVIVDPTYVGTAAPTLLGAPQFQNTVTMSDWTLRADVGRGSTATAYRNVVIFKFCEGTLRDRVAAPERWSDATQFSLLASEPDTEDALRLSGLSQWLREYVDAAIAERDAGNPLYVDFAEIATRADWNGILVLQADVARVPAELEGAMAGVDPAQLTAHHFGATVTPVKAGTGGPDVGRSSLFGLVDYELPIYRQNVTTGAGPDVPVGIEVDGSYGFTVLQLQALFRNAALVDFRSRVQLTVKELFGSRVGAAYGITGLAPATGVVLRGSYQSQGGKDAYVFEQDARTVFTLDDDVLQAVAFDRVQLDALGLIGSGDAAVIASRFLIWGNLDFAALTDPKGESFDVLSFGSPAGSAPEALGAGLAFSNLTIEMRAPAATPTATTFAFDASGVAFDLATSTRRPGSLFESLALQLDSFLSAPAGKRPADYGYLPVGSDLRLDAFDGAWYAIVYKLTLGTPGALVATAGFESRLVAGWAPRPKTGRGSASYALVTGIQLPGAAPGAKLLSLQGVLKLSIGAIRLLRQEVAGHAGQKAFVLQLRNVGLKFLGVAKLPPGATIDFFLFGALQGTGSLGWYAAYRKDAEEEGLLALEAPREQLEVAP